MLLAIVGYGAMQNSASQTPAQPEPSGTQSKSDAPVPDSVVASWVGREPRPWSIPASSWANAPRPLTPADLKGRVTVLEFWRTGCSHCEDAVPFMNALKKRFGPKLQIITFQSPGLLDDPENPETSWTEVKKWISEHGVSYPVAFDEGRKVKNSYNVNLYPFVMLVDPQGKIVHSHTGHTREKAEDLIRQIQQLTAT